MKLVFKKITYFSSSNGKGYGSKLNESGIRSTEVIFGCFRGHVSTIIQFMVMDGDDSPEYCVIGNEYMRVYDVNLSLNQYYCTIGHNVERKFKTELLKASFVLNMEGSDVAVGRKS